MAQRPDLHHETTRARTGAITRRDTPMATLTPDQLLEAFEQMTVLELSDFKKKFEERFGVTAAAPVAFAGRRPGSRWRRPGRRGRGGADRVHRHPDRDRPQQDPGHQGRPRAHRPRPQGGQGPRRRGPQGREGGRHQGRGREDQGRDRGAGRQGRDQVTTPAMRGPTVATTRRRPVTDGGGGMAACHPPRHSTRHPRATATLPSLVRPCPGVDMPRDRGILLLL